MDVVIYNVFLSSSFELADASAAITF